jgi:hypothetical protein
LRRISSIVILLPGKSGWGTPRKIRQLKSDLRKAGFVERKDRGKGSHARWFDVAVPEVFVQLAGHDGDDARAYQERDVRQAIALVQSDET